ncbi:hypothetical protein C8N46_11324 [Kordia periserrulae]|uniref:Tetratricopeptide repeat protein n=1 Tax=Kordia periserrulae TaxID=701523 RepID=A0A2T6BR68_9FLAO|nr:hypothetical protein [Kordia periserrulae]PTX58534.1 hypothetical protein C8N46_11324 [Kordia periserrulae]
MNISDFTYILQNPVHINAAQTEAIAAIAKQFPYFQAARVVHLKGLKNQDSFQYNQHLKITAAYTTDRSILFDFITSNTFEQHEISSTIKETHNNINDIDVTAEEVVVNQHLLMEEAIKTKIQEADAILDPELFQPKEIKVEPELESEPELEVEVETKTVTATETETPVETDTKKSKKKRKKDKKKKKKEKAAKKVTSTSEAPEETLQLGKPLSFNKSEKHSFAEWLQLTNFQPIDRSDERPKIITSEEETAPKEVTKSEKAAPNEAEKQKRFALIDKFIGKNPKITPKPTLEKTINLASDASVDQSVLMTETLAKVYLEQKKYKKAIKAYDILILKYPEKSGFFADQIRAIKKLQQNN